MASAPFFSIVIPTYNRAALIPATLRSVLAQDFAAFEVLVVDDGSKDNTAEVVRPFTEADARVQYFQKVNEERGAARNYGVARAKGEYVLFLDSDDLLHPNHLSTLHAGIQQYQQPNFIASKFNLDRNGYVSSSDIMGVPGGSYGLDFFVRGNALACNICVRRQNPGLKLFEEDRSFAAVEDWMFMLENTQNDTVRLLDAVTLTMNDHDARSMRSDNQALIQRWLRLMKWTEARLRLTAAQNQVLCGHIYYLCAVHAYADNHRSEALGYLRQARPILSARKLLPLLARIVAGPQLVERIKALR